MPLARKPFHPIARSLRWGIGRAAALVVPAVLAGCSGMSSNTFPPSCPRAGILADAADITRYRPGAAGQDLTDMVLDGRITGVSGSCARDGSRQLDVTVSASITLVRGPAARSGMEDVPLFVAVSDEGQLIDKQVYRIVPGFAPNADTLRLTSDPVTIHLPVSRSKTGSGYNVVVGFQLTPDELAINRRRGPR
jgi:hypothetical protein